jgi:hypothetical protein
MEGVESTSSVQNTQGPPQGPPQPQIQIQQPETTGSTSYASLAEKFPNYKLNEKSKFTVQKVNGVDKIIFDQPFRKTAEDGSLALSTNDQLGQKYTWTTVTKGPKHVAVAIASSAVPGETTQDKKNFAYGMIYKEPGLISFSPRSIKGIQYFGASFDSNEHAQQACTKQVSAENQSKYALVSDINANSPATTFLVTFHDVPLDIDRPLFSQFLQKYGDTESIRYKLNGLYYNVQVIYKDKAVKMHFESWSLQFQKNCFRVSHQDLTNDDILLRQKFSLKLTNLPVNTWPVDLDAILTKAEAATCFIPKKPSSETYSRARFAVVHFKSEELMKAAAKQAYVLQTRSVIWVPADTPLCMECGSSRHHYRVCREYRDKYTRLERSDHFRSIQQRFGAIPKPKPRPGQQHGFNNINNQVHPNFPVPTMSYAQIANLSKPPGYGPRDFTNQRFNQAEKGKNRSGPSTNSATVPQNNNKFQTQTGQSNSTSVPNQSKQSTAAPSSLQTIRDNQNNFNTRLMKLEEQMQQFMTQMSTMLQTIAGLQTMVAQTNFETQSKLDQIAEHLKLPPPESLYDDEDFEHGSRKRKSRRSSEADKNILSSSRSYVSPNYPTAPVPPVPVANDDDRRLAQLENTMSSGMQQMASVTASIETFMSNFQQPPQPINRSTPIVPTPIVFTNPQTPSTWSSAAGTTSWTDDTVMPDNNANIDIEYEESVQGDESSRESTQ